MGTCPPKFRSDLVISRQEAGGRTVYVVKDPISQEYFHFGEAERYITERLDGQTPLESVRQHAEAQFGSSLSSEGLQAFLHKLETAGLLESSAAKKRKTAPVGRLSGSFLYLRYKLVDPSRLFERLEPRIGFLFTPLFVFLSAATIALAAGVLFANWSGYLRDASTLVRLSAIPSLVVVLFIVVSLHEMAHGLTCRHFGGQVREMGFLLIYFQPALYCDVSDAWLFPEKAKRLWVSFAGGYFELLLWALAVLMWRVAEADTWLSWFALVAMTGSGIKTLLNFNPLIKLDGYYLLSDFLEIPNLRRKAFGYVGHMLKRLWDPHHVVPQATRRERRIYVTYGVVASVGSFAVLTYALLVTGEAILYLGQPLLLCGFAALVGTRFRRRVRSLFGKPGGADGDDGDDFGATFVTASRAIPAPDREDPGNAPAPKGPTIAPTPKSKPRRALMKPAALASRYAKWVLAAALLGLLLFGRMELRIAGPFNVLPEENADVRASVEGIIDEILVEEGNHVRRGDVIARLSGDTLRAELNKTEAEMREHQATHRKLVAGATAAEIQVAQAAVLKAEDQLKVGRASLAKAEGQVQHMRSRLPRFQQLYQEQLTSRMEYEEARQQVVIAENELGEATARVGVLLKELAEAQSKLNVLLGGTRPEEIEATGARVERLEAQARYLREQLRALEVLSPADGIVATPSRQLRQMRRQMVKKGDLIAKVYDFRKVTAHILIPEKEIADVRVGQRVVLKARAYPDREFQGTVTFIATSALGGSAPGDASPMAGISAVPAAAGGKQVLVSTEIGNEESLLKPEMTGQAKVFAGERSIAGIILRRISRTLKVEFWSWW